MGTNENNDAFYKRNLAVPFFTQRDNTYIWQRKEKNGQIWKDDDGKEGPKYPMAWRSCNITSLCMVLHYWGLTEETPDQMLEKIFEKGEWGWSEEEYCRDTEKKIYKGAARVEVWENLKRVAGLYT